MLFFKGSNLNPWIENLQRRGQKQNLYEELI